jgi:hypothetical protein
MALSYTSAESEIDSGRRLDHHSAQPMPITAQTTIVMPLL